MSQPKAIVDLDVSKALKCSNCGCLFFNQVFMIIPIPVVYQPLLGNQTTYQQPFPQCIKCGKIMGDEPEVTKPEIVKP